MNTKKAESLRSDCHEIFEARHSPLEPLKGSTLVVTGGTGFMGSWIAEAVSYLNDQHGFNTQLLLIARSTDQFRSEKSHLASRKDITLIKSDIRHTLELPKETQWVIHAAATPDTRFHATHSVETMSVIAEGTTAILRAVDRCSNFRMMLNLSSGLIYGQQPWELERVPETFAGAPSAGSVSSAYAEAKRFAETFCSAARSQARIPIVTARPFTFIGPYQSLEGPWALNGFMRDAIAGNPIRVLGDGQTVRSYLYGSDLAYWLLRILTGASSGQTYNLGSPVGISLEGLASQVADQFNPKPEIRLRASGSPSLLRTRLVPDISLAHESLGLDAWTPLGTALSRTIAWNRG
jgi:dTDP-glucose 4,6-dehydratase